MRNSAYLDVATASRYRYLSDSGFTQARLAELGIGAVVRCDNVEYKKEVRHGDPLRIELRLGGASPRVSRFRFHNRIYAGDRLAGIVDTVCGWFDLHERRLVFPPAELSAVMLNLERTDDFEEMRESVRL